MRLRELDAWRVRHDPWLKQTFSEARKILVTSPHLFGIFDDAQHKKMAVFVEHGLDTVHVRSADLQNESKLRLLYVGRVVRTKGLRDAVRALALLPESLDYSFDVIGDGPDLPAVKAEAKELGVEGKINFVGRLPRSEIDAYYARANLFVFPSFREAAGGVIIEAMSHGVPQLCANYGGPAGIVTKETGVLVDPTNPSKFASDLAEKITRLAIDRMRLSRLAEGAATEAARTYLWERRGEILATYIDMFIGAEPKLDVHKSARLE